MSLVCPSCAVRLACRYRCVRVPTRRCRQSAWYGMSGVGTALRRRPRRVGGTAMSLVCPSCVVRLACRYRCVRVPTRRCRQSAWHGMPGVGTALRRRPRRVGGTAMSLVCPSCAVRLACRYGRVRVPTRRCRQSAWYGKLDGQQVPEHDTKRATQPIFVNLARAPECQDRRKTAPSAALKKPRRFPSLAARFFTICLNSKKSRRS